MIEEEKIAGFENQPVAADSDKLPDSVGFGAPPSINPEKFSSVIDGGWFVVKFPKTMSQSFASSDLTQKFKLNKC